MWRKGQIVKALPSRNVWLFFAAVYAASVLLYLPVLQLLAFHRSLAKGLNPDRPKNLTAVVQLDL